MKIILLEKVEKLGSLGDQVEVKNGYARNYLLPTGKALRATEENIKYFEEKASDLKKKNDKDVKEANKFLDKITGKNFCCDKASWRKWSALWFSDNSRYCQPSKR